MCEGEREGICKRHNQRGPLVEIIPDAYSIRVWNNFTACSRVGIYAVYPRADMRFAINVLYCKLINVASIVLISFLYKRLMTG